MFIALQARSPHALSSRDASVTSLKHCWDMLKCENKTFLTLVTSAFPCAKVRASHLFFQLPLDPRPECYEPILDPLPPPFLIFTEWPEQYNSVTSYPSNTGNNLNERFV